jgi:hypothetical protein
VNYNCVPTNFITTHKKKEEEEDVKYLPFGISPDWGRRLML